MSRISQGFEHLKCVLVNPISVEVLGHGAVVHVGQFVVARSFVEEEVFDVYLVDVSNALVDVLVVG